ncbi:MAG: transglycosylase SLT domain-containing protein [Planctomycetota bacterium]|jgi:hypothetical protein
MGREAYFWNEYYNDYNGRYQYREVNGNLYMPIESVAQVAYDAGFRGESLLAIVAIAGRESSYSPVVHGTDANQLRVSGDRGLWQINYVHDKNLAEAGIISSTSAAGKRELFDPLVNAKAAFYLSSQGTSFAPWNAAKGGYTADGDPFYGTNVFKAAEAIRNAGLGDEISSWSGQRNPSLFERGTTPNTYPQGTLYRQNDADLEQGYGVPEPVDIMTILRTLRQVGLGNTEGLETFTQARMNADDERPLNYRQTSANDEIVEPASNTINLSNVLTPPGQQTVGDRTPYVAETPSMSSGTSIRQVEGPGAEAVLEPDEPLPFVNPPRTQPQPSQEDQQRSNEIQQTIARIANNLQSKYAACLLDPKECSGLTASERATLRKVRTNPNSDLFNELKPMIRSGFQGANISSNPAGAVENELQRIDGVLGYVPKTSGNTSIRQIEGGYDPERPTPEQAYGLQVPVPSLEVPVPSLETPPATDLSSDAVVIDDPTFWQGVYIKGQTWGPDDNSVVESTGDSYVPYDWEAAAQELYPQYWAIVKNNPEIAQLLRDSLGPPAWSDAKFNAKLYETNWWKSTSASVRQWDTASQLDPATYQAKVEAQATAITQIALDKGIKLSDETLTELATNSLRMGWTNQMTLNAIGMAAVESGTTGMSQLSEGYYGQQMRQYASDYGVSVADTTFTNYLNKIAVGEENLNSFQDYVLTIGKSLYPTLAEQFDAGQTFDTATAGYKSIAANILERDSTSIDMMDPMFVTAVTYQPDTTTGEQRMMNMAEWGSYLRNNESLGYEYTTEARSRAYATADKIANMFGRI